MIQSQIKLSIPLAYIYQLSHKKVGPHKNFPSNSSEHSYPYHKLLYSYTTPNRFISIVFTFPLIFYRSRVLSLLSSNPLAHKHAKLNELSINLTPKGYLYKTKSQLLTFSACFFNILYRFSSFEDNSPVSSLSCCNFCSSPLLKLK